MSDICEASVWKAAATASVIIEKKIALTRSENKPTSSASTKDSPSATTSPTRIDDQPGPMLLEAMATPYAPMPKNIVCAKLTIPV
jgi:hypothetical protein